MQDHTRENRAFEAPLDVVEEASEGSFPASDAPGWAIGQLYPAEPPETTSATAHGGQERPGAGQEPRPRPSGRDEGEA